METLDDSPSSAVPSSDTLAPLSDPPAALLARLSHPQPLDGPGGIWSVFNAYYAKYAPFVARILNRRRDLGPESVRDLTQGIFVTVNKVIARNEPIKNPEALLVTIAGRAVANHKRRWMLPIEDGADMETFAGAGLNPEALAERCERLDRLMGRMETMKLEHQMLIHCVDVLEMTFEEVAAAQGCPMGTAYKRYRRARRILDEILVAAADEDADPSAPGTAPSLERHDEGRGGK